MSIMLARRRWVLVTGLVLLGIALRVVAIHVLRMPERYTYDAGGYLTLDGEHGDAREYEGRGWQLVDGGSFWAVPSGDGNSPPGYPLLIAACYAVFGRGFMTLLYLNALLGGLAAIPAYLLGRRLFSPAAGLLAAAGVVSDPLLVFWSTQVLTETLSVLLIMVAVVMMLRLAEPAGGARRAALIGMVMAIPALVRNVFMVLPIVVVAWAISVFRSDGRARRRMYVAAGICGLVTFMAGAWAANQRPAGIRTQWQLLVNRENLGRGGYVDVAVREAETSRGGDLEVSERARIEEEASSYARRERLPVLLLRTWTSRLEDFWRVVPGTGSALERRLYAVSSLGLFALAAIGAALAWAGRPGRRAELALLAGIVVMTTLVHCAIAASPRYRIPLHPILWVFAGSALAASAGTLVQPFSRIAASTQRFGRR